ncbi:Hypothetical predicted protein [Octopus vulgaris]|uniref:Uncharacterized protein n=1 Tax=Octopus vulgaris TaxID=6645 RepID=A0AA36B7V7_OCTVU|nr:Hypothetical predicted protein [Octopus vulgaris]
MELFSKMFIKCKDIIAQFPEEQRPQLTGKGTPPPRRGKGTPPLPPRVRPPRPPGERKTQTDRQAEKETGKGEREKGGRRK